MEGYTQETRQKVMPSISGATFQRFIPKSQGESKVEDIKPTYVAVCVARASISPGDTQRNVPSTGGRGDSRVWLRLGLSGGHRPHLGAEKPALGGIHPVHTQVMKQRGHHGCQVPIWQSSQSAGLATREGRMPGGCCGAVGRRH